MEQSRASAGNEAERVESGVSSRWAAIKAAHPGLRRLVDAWALFTERNGGQYAGAMTFYSFLALFPLLLLAVSITGFVLHSHPAAQQSLFDHITSNIPGSFGTTIKSSLHTAIQARTGVGVVGLAGVLFTGLGWIGNLRAAVNALWGTRPAKRNFLMTRVINLGVLAGLGLGVLVSVGLSVVGTSLTQQIVSKLGWSNDLHWLVKVVSIAVALVGDVLIFGYALIRLPKADVSWSTALKGSLFAAVGFEVLKIVGTYTIAKSSHSPTAGPFAALLAVLVWIKLVAQLLLYVAAWMSVLNREASTELVPAPSRALVPTAPADDDRADAGEGAPSPVAVAGSLFGVGAAVGAAAVALATRRRRDEPDGDG